MSRPRRIKVNTALRFYHEVLGLEHLQYGLWDDDDPPTLDGLRRAQQRYATTLHGWIPEGVRTVLDVGCGTGAGSLALRNMGYEVEGVSPDPYQQKLYGRVGRPFHLARFQDFEPAATFDLVLFSESAQYIWLPSFFPAVLRVVAGGYLLLADYFVETDDGSHLAKSGHPHERFLALAREHGLELVRGEDVTERVLPTLALGRSWIDRFLQPSLDLAAESASSRRPWLWSVARFLFGGKLAKHRQEVLELTDGARFREVKRYMFYLFRVP